MTPTISTNRLSLRPLTKSTPRQIGWLIDPEVVKYSEQRHQNHNLKSQLRYIDTFGGKSHLWGIYLAATGDHIGNVSAVHDDDNKVSDVGILIGERKCWGLGMGREAWKAACTWLLDPLCGDIRKLEAGCMRENEAMVKIIRANGFDLEGERKNHFLLDGRPVGMMLFGRHR
jgi:[ribosomal protein S5]-alanine N-acetyltransferase